MNEMLSTLKTMVEILNKNEYGKTNGDTEYALGYRLAQYDLITEMCHTIGYKLEAEPMMNNGMIYPRYTIVNAE